MPREPLTDDDAAELVAVCKGCGETVAIGWRMKNVSPFVAAQEAAEALREHQKVCAGAA